MRGWMCWKIVQRGSDGEDWCGGRDIVVVSGLGDG